MQHIQEMHQIFSHGLIGAHRESELALRSGETTRSLDEPMPQVSSFSKAQAAGRFGSALSAAGEASICNSRDRLWAIMAHRVKS